MKIDVLSKSGKKSSKIEVKAEIFTDKLNKDLISQVFRVEKLSRKKPVHTKDRSERSGGGRKPWRQKGTGRARHGSIRSPLWRKGGVTFGPRKENNFKKKVNKGMKRKSVASLIADQEKNGRLFVITGFPKVEKTKELEKFILKLPLKEAGSILTIIDEGSKDIIRYSRNIPYINVYDKSGLNTYNLLNSDYLIITKKALEEFISLVDKNKD